MMYLDLAELDQVFAGRWFWSTRRMAPGRFKRDNYLGDPAVPLDQSVRDLVEAQSGVRPNGPVRLLTNLSYFGYCFNPISLYYCFDSADSRVTQIVAHVSNTPWGESTCYVLSHPAKRCDDRTMRFNSGKDMHVSPFMDMDIDYDWLLTQPGDDLVVRIDNRTDGERFFNAKLILQREEITGASLAGILFRFPFMTLKIVFGIYWQAMRLWLKGCPLYTHPDKTKSIQVNS
jgi:DUF1365 family protein